MIYGYARVSTIGQSKDGNSLEHQERQLRSAGAEEIVKESFTGTKRERPKFKKLLEKLHDGDTLIVTKLDRFARNTREGLEIVQELMNKNVIFKVMNMGTFDNSPQGKMSFTIFLAFAEYERDMIVQRTQEGKAIAKLDENFTEGRPKKFSPEQLDHAMMLLNDHSYTAVSQKTGISKSTLVREARKRKEPVQN